jgi:16S rRNA (cytosine1402-N4)-methyltransferase
MRRRFSGPARAACWVWIGIRPALAHARGRLAEWENRVDLAHADYRDLPSLLAARGIRDVAGVLADLGVSSLQLDDSARGFSFREPGPLDMRMDPTRGEPLAARLAQVDPTTLANVIFEFGEERRSRQVARAILAARDRGELHTTTDLAAATRRGVGARGWQRRDPATRTFQALRIWVNSELEGLEGFVMSAFAALGRGGRLAVIAFHSLEDRVVKQAMRGLAAAGLARLLTRRPIVAGDEEVAHNARARSARLRAVEKVA